MDKQVLYEIGLSNGEVEVYLGLLKNGESKTGEIIRVTELTSSNVYRILDLLIDKGLVSYTIRDNVRYFNAVSAKRLVGFLEEKKKKLSELIPELEKASKTEETQTSGVYVGYKAIGAAYEESMEELEKGDETLFFSIGEEDFSNENVKTFFMNLAVKRKEKEIKMRGIALPQTRKVFEKYPAKVNMRYLDLRLPTGVSVYKTKVIIISWKEKPTAIVIKSKNIADSYRAFFEEIWKQAKD